MPQMRTGTRPAIPLSKSSRWLSLSLPSGLGYRSQAQSGRIIPASGCTVFPRISIVLIVSRHEDNRGREVVAEEFQNIKAIAEGFRNCHPDEDIWLWVRFEDIAAQTAFTSAIYEL